MKGVLDDDGIASHERAATALYEIVREAWSTADGAYRAGRTITEGVIRRAILDGMERRGVRTDHAPIVAAGSGSGDPHYDFSGDGEPLREGDVVQLDLWARELQPESIYADISWVGCYGPKPDDEIAEAWKTLIASRDEAVRFVSERMKSGAPTTGAEVDARVRGILTEAGYGGALRHRTGHGIDTECHGSGVNLDSVEFPDRRLLLEGSCFSVEPGLYFERFGLRTEIDVYIRGGVPRISGEEPQREILRCGRSVF
jgi:Xaa-Pro aminopeptidase